jgi:hypothetical protein
MIGLPRKNNITHPIYGWQKEIFDALQQYKLIAILKGRGVGASEFLLRYALWLCLKDNKLRGKNVCVVTGIRENLSIELINRFRNLLPNFDWQGREGTAEINGCRIIGYPSKRIKDLRGLTDTKLVICDEFAFFDPADQLQVLPVLEAFRQKSDSQIVLLSTPGPMNDVFYNLYQEPPDTCRYHRLYISYEKALGSLISEQEITQAKRQPGFAQEFELKFGTPYSVGSIFSLSDIDRAVSLGKQYDSDPVIDINPDAEVHAIGCDPGWGHSKFGISMVQLMDDKLHVVISEEYSQPNEDEMIERLLALRRRTRHMNTTKIFIDSANTSFIRRLKGCIPAERTDYENYTEDLRRRRLIRPPDEQQLVHYMTVVPVSFLKYGPKMLATLYAFMQRNDLTIHPKFSVLISQLQSARNIPGRSSQFVLDKSGVGNSFDCLDSLRLSLWNFDAGVPEIETPKEEEEEESLATKYA